jgi:hypothetical protein
VRWPLRRDGPKATGPRRESTEALEPRPPLYRSPTLKVLLARLEGDAPHRILDLHSAVGPNVEFLSRYACRLQIVDLLAALRSEEPHPESQADPAAVFRKSLPQPPEPFDVVLAWDVPNYLSRVQFAGLATHLGTLCRPGALMLALISTSKQISDLPLVFKIVDEQTLLWQPQTTAVRSSPRFPPADVEKMTPGFLVVHSVLMRHGVQEYLFARKQDRETPG